MLSMMNNSRVFMLLIGLVLCLVILSQTTTTETLNTAQTSGLGSNIIDEWIKIDTMQEKAASIDDVRPVTVDGFPIFPHHFQQGSRAIPEQKVIIGFNIKPKMSHDEISAAQEDPSSPLYNKKLTSEDIRSATVNPEGTNAVKTYLENHGADVLITADNGLILSATAPVHVWEKAFNTQFHHYQDELNPKSVLIRAPHVSLPSGIAPHVEDIRNAVDFPSPFGRITKQMKETRRAAIAKSQSEENAAK